MIEITRSRVGQTTLINVHGRIDAVNARNLHHAIEHELARDRQDLLIQMSGVNYFSAAGLRVFKRIYDEIGQVHIVDPSDRVKEILHITGLDVVYQIYDTRTEAIHAVSRVTNAHTHLELGWLADHCPGVMGSSFVSWIQETIDDGWRNLSEDWESIVDKAIAHGIEKLVESGTTMIADVTSTGRSIGPLLESGLRGIVYVEMLGTDPAKIDERFIKARDIINTWRPYETDRMKIGLSIHAPYSVHPYLWSRALEYARKEALPLCIHVAESAAEYDFLLNGNGEMVDEYYGNDMPAIASPYLTPIGYLEELGALEHKPLLIHSVYVNDADIAKIKASGCTVVHCPRSNLRLRGDRMPLEKYLENGIPVLLGTDSLASSPSLDIFEEVEVAVALHHGKVKSGDVAGIVHNSLPGLEN